MAVGAVTVRKQGVVGNMKYAIVDIVGAASYTTTGDSVDLNAICGMGTAIHFAECTATKTTPPAVNNPVPTYDIVTKKLQMWGTAAAAAGATEATATTNFSTLTITVFVWGN